MCLRGLFFRAGAIRRIWEVCGTVSELSVQAVVLQGGISSSYEDVLPVIEGLQFTHVHTTMILSLFTFENAARCPQLSKREIALPPANQFSEIVEHSLKIFRKIMLEVCPLFRGKLEYLRVGVGEELVLISQTRSAQYAEAVTRSVVWTTKLQKFYVTGFKSSVICSE